MGRPRSPGNEDLPDNLYPHRNGWKYVRPTDGKPIYWRGVSREAAKRAATKANDLLAPARADLVQQAIGAVHTVADTIKVFRDEALPEYKWKDKTKTEHEFRLARVEADIGRLEVGTYTVAQAAEYLKEVTSSLTARQKYRYLLIEVFDCAVEQGWVETNVFAITRKVKGIARERARLTPEGYDAIFTKAGELGLTGLQNAMRLGRKTLLRRGDLCYLRFADYDNRVLEVRPKKTADSTGVRLRITADDELDAIIAGCRDTVLSPFMVHQMPGKMRPKDQRAEEREHHTQVLPEQLTRLFASARDESKFYDGAENPPTLHEIRSLGMDDLRKKGWAEERIQQLATHASVDMTKHYLEGHEPPWTEVSL